MKFWFTADMHLGHKNIIEYCNRPFESIYHMNEEIIRRYNERVKPEDVVFHIGDFCFKGSWKEGKHVTSAEWEKRLNGKIIHIKGNHDYHNSCKTIINGILIEFANEKVYLVHNPEHYNHLYKINFVGHIHEKWQCKKIKQPYGKDYTYLVNVGVDVHNFYPVNFEEIMKRLNKFKKENQK